MKLTPKEKAKELLDKMSSQTYKYQPYAGANYITEEVGWEAGKKCASIAVDEIIKIKLLWFQKDTEYLDFWKEVKEELLKM